MELSGYLHALVALPLRRPIINTLWIGGWVVTKDGLDVETSPERYIIPFT
jgi:hypothetical protein